MRNTLRLLNEIRLQAETTSELESEVCKEIYYTSKNVIKQLTKFQEKFIRALSDPHLEQQRYD